MQSLTLKLLLTIIFIFGYATLKAQEAQQIDEGTLAEEKKISNWYKENEVDINILFNYYDQDGNHSPVTGGIGTEKLQSGAMKIMVSVPLDSVSILNISTLANAYSSASTDNIDTNVSSASSEDLRLQIDVGYTKKVDEQHRYMLKVSGSTESDYVSKSIGGSWSIDSEDGNRQFEINAQAFFDNWVPIFPEELRGTDNTLIPTTKRKSYNVGVNYSQVINEKLQVLFSTEIVYQRGLLSTPFHRVYFQLEGLPKIEKLPMAKFKFPLGLRVNYFLNDYIVIRSYYRYYSDNFRIKAHTVSIEVPIKFNSFFSVYPFYRWHAQTAAKYFSPYKEHAISKGFYTSDYDLSAFDSYKVGLGIHYTPVWGIGRFRLFSKKKITIFKGIDLRIAKYARSDGLDAFMISTNFAFTIE